MYIFAVQKPSKTTGYGSKIKPPGDRRFWSMFPLTRVPFGVPIFDPQPTSYLEKHP